MRGRGLEEALVINNKKELTDEDNSYSSGTVCDSKCAK